MCVGLTLTYMTTKVPNFAHSNFVVISIFCGATAFLFGGFASPYFGVPVAAVAGGVVAVLMYLLILKPLTQRGANIVVLMIATLAVSIFFDAFVAATFFTYLQGTYARFLANKGYYLYSLNQLPDFNIFGVRGILLVAPVTLILVTLAITYLLRTRFGVAMRAAMCKGW